MVRVAHTRAPVAVEPSTHATCLRHAARARTANGNGRGLSTTLFFERLDRNGDGTVSKGEFRQTMRDLGTEFGLTSEHLGKKGVDEMFGELDVRDRSLHAPVTPLRL